MATSASRSRKHGVGATLRIARYNRLVGEAQAWRTNPGLKQLKIAKGSALVLPFVKGLRLSAQLIYILREELSEKSVEVDWGHLLDDKDESCSPECDIIVHYKGHVEEWDGNKKPIMHFKFVRQSRALAVISCKSFAKEKDVDTKYVQRLQPFVKNVFLFAECCGPKKVALLRKKARRAGYAGFGYLYAFDEKNSECVPDAKAWLNFLDAVSSKIAQAVSRNE